MPTFVKVERTSGKPTLDTIDNKILRIPTSRTNHSSILIVGDHSLISSNLNKIQLTTVVSSTKISPIWLGENSNDCYIPEDNKNTMLIKKTPTPVRLDFLNTETDIEEIQISRQPFKNNN
jgi:hypothetical protein